MQVLDAQTNVPLEGIPSFDLAVALKGGGKSPAYRTHGGVWYPVPLDRVTYYTLVLKERVVEVTLR